MKLWILIADAGRGRVFASVGGDGPLFEVEGFVHPESRLRGHDFLTDRPGHVRTGPGGISATAMPPHTDPKEATEDLFAAELARLLRRAREEGRFEQLALVSPPRFLGRVRAHLDGETARRVIASVHKDLTLLEPHALRGHLAEVFDASARAPFTASI